MTNLTDRFSRAVEYAREQHAADTRKGTSIPYLSHLLGVASIALDYGANEDQAIAALLHDVVEDHGGLEALREIEDRFGPEVARIVLACSDSTEENKPDWQERKKKYVAAISHKQADELLVSAADKVHNARAFWPTIGRSGTSCGAGSGRRAARTSCGTTGRLPTRSSHVASRLGRSPRSSIAW